MFVGIFGMLDPLGTRSPAGPRLWELLPREFSRYGVAMFRDMFGFLSTGGDPPGESPP